METNKYLDPIPAIEVKQGEDTFYIFTISAKKLLSISYTSERTKENKTGVQRGLRTDRLIEIGKYLKGNTSGNPILPNTIIVSLSSNSHFENGHINILNKQNGEAFVVDGQHRLWSFQEKYSGDTDFNIVVSSFIELSDEKKALIFKTINGKQRKINPSLVYDLIPMLKDKNWVEFESWRSQEIVQFLNEDSKSPWNNKISMVGEPGKIISQSSFITAIKKLFKKNHLFSQDFNDFTEAVIQENILVIYFNVIANLYSKEWDNKDYLICKYVGVSALLTLFEKIIFDLREKKVIIINNEGSQLTEEMILPYILKLRIFSFSTKEMKNEGKSFVGEGGINELYKKISSIVFA